MVDFLPYYLPDKTKMIKILYFDTSAIIKYFIREKGSDLIKWIVDNHVPYSLTLRTSQIAIYEFKKILKEKEKRGEIDNNKYIKIIDKSKYYFSHVFSIIDFRRVPRFKSTKGTNYLELCNKHKITIEKNSGDARHLACVINYLRCFGGVSRPRIITADLKFVRVIKAEGYDVVNPEKISKGEFLLNISK